jgi:pyruvate/2-oxoglutarate dehydrogenase complex dihydrolipoamide acyltransferase (E2) component
MHVPERLVVAPSAGVFQWLPPEASTTEGGLVVSGQPIGVVEGPRTSTQVCSPFAGFLMGMLAEPGERIRAGQPVAWLRIT